MDIKELIGKPDELIEAIKDSVIQPDVGALSKDWDEQQHEIMVNLERYPDRVVTVEPAKTYIDPSTGTSVDVEAKKKDEPINRLPLALEQDIVNVHTAFTVGTEPSMEFTANDDKEEVLFNVLNDVLIRNKTKYNNKAIVRSWFSETQVAEYWYLDDDEKFWNGIYKKNGITGATPNKQLKSAIWSPFRGDTLYPIFDRHGSMLAFGRGYIIKEGSDDIDCFTLITDTKIYEYEDRDGWQFIESKAHGFNKIPVIYAERNESLTRKIRPLRERLEAIISSYADCIDYHFFPYLLLEGDVMNAEGRPKSRVIKLTGGSKASYLTWDQVPTTIKLELETITNQIYSLTNTPRIGFNELQSFGKSLSGTAFKFMFMGAHMAVENHAEEIGEFFQRRVNFLIDALGTIWTMAKESSESIMVEVDIVPYMIDSLKDKVEIAVEAVNGGVWSREQGIIFAGNTDRVLEELEKIEGKTPSEE